MKFGHHHIKFLATLILSIWTVLAEAQFTTQTSLPGATVSSSPSDPRYIGLSTGRVTSYTSSNWSQDDTCHYWLSPTALTGLIRGNNTSSSCTGLSTVTYSSGLSNLSGGIIVYTGTTQYTYLTTGYSWYNATLSVRCTLTVTDGSGSAKAISSGGGYFYSRADENFNVRILINVYSPSNAWYPSGGSGNQWIPALQLFNYLQTPSTYKICTSYSPTFGYIQHNSTPAVNDSTACFGQTVSFTSLYTSPSISRTWTNPSGSTASTSTGFSISANPINHNGWWLLNSTGSFGCDAPPDSIYLVVSPDMSVSMATDSNVSCNGGSDGAITSTPTGGISPLTYSWFGTSATTAAVSGLTAGFYNVTVTDSIGCTEAGSGITITQPTALGASTAADTNVSCYGLSDGVASSSVTGGTSPISYLWSNSATTNNINGLTAGSYGLTVTDNNGCQDSSNVTITQPDSLEATVTIDSTVSCFGGSNGGMTGSGAGGTTPYTYAWSTTATTATITGLTAATYSVTITDSNNCTDIDSATIVEPALFVSTAVVDSNVSCFGFTDGVATGGGVSFGSNTYLWSNGDTASTATGLAAGTYSVTVTNPSGCFDSSSVSITEPTLLVVSSSLDSNVTCFGGSNGGATSSATGGVTPYSYLWNSGATTAVISGVTASTYIITITDSNGCFDTSSVDITEPADLLTTIAVDSSVSCNGFADGALTASTSGGTTPYSYSWNTGASTASVSGLTAGNYTVTVADSNSCQTIETVAVTEPAALVATSSLDSNVSCNGNSDGGATVSGTGGTTAYTYSWSNGATTASVTGLTAGTYSVTITDANTCEDSASITITEPVVFVSSAVVDDNVSCFGLSDGQATASGTGGTTPFAYSWSNGATTATASSLAAGTYSVTITDFNGCVDSSSVTITQPTVLVASASVDSNVTCFGFANGGGTSSATGGVTPYTYSWSNSATTAVISGIVAGTYSITVTDSNGCTDSASITITQPPAMISTSVVDSNVTCNGLSDGGVSTSTTGGVTPYTYSWSTGSTATSLTGLTAATYSVTVTDSNGCTDSSSAIVTEPALLVATSVLDSNVSCNGFSDGGATVSGTGGTTAYTYSWSTGAVTASITGLTAGTYSVTITDANDCTDSASITITEPNVLVSSASVNDHVSCFGLSDGEGQASATGGTTPYGYSWSNGATTAIAGTLAAGTYSVTVSDLNGCFDSSSITITQPTVLVASAAVDSNVSCFGLADGAGTASGTGGTTPYAYSWSNSATSASLVGVVAGTYSVTLTDGNGCTDSASITITQPAALISTTVVDSNVTCFGLSNGGVSTSATGGVTPFSYSWSTGSTATVLAGITAATYSVTVTDSNGCTDSSSATVTEPALLVATSALDSNVSCFGLSDGGASVSGVGGTTPYAYSWNTGGITSSVAGLTAGTYSVTITDVNNCDDSASIVITEPNLLVASAFLDSNVSCFGYSNGGASSTVSGGTTPYSYAWSNSTTSSSITGVVASTYTLTVTDNNNCQDTAEVDIGTTPDTIDPTIVCPGNDTLVTNGSCQITVPDYTSLAVTGDNCDPSVDVTQSPAPSTVLSGLGAVTITLTATDDSANSSECTFVLMRIDTMAPSITCPDDDTLYLESTCTVQLPDYTNSVVSADECTDVTISQSPVSGTVLSTVSGTITVTLTATDSSGNATSCSIQVTTLDSTSPDISACVPNSTVAGDANCEYVVPDYSSQLTVSDNCTSTLTIGQSLTAGTVVSLGSYTITMTATDSSGNSSTCDFTLIVNDSTAPVLTCPGDTTLDNDLNACGAVVNYSAPVATDNCTQVMSVVQFVGLPSGSLFPIGVTVNSFSVEDTAGNADTCSFTVTVNDTAAPIFSCPNDTVLSNDPDSCGAVFTFGLPTATDNCGVDSLIQTQGPATGSLFPVGNTLLEFRAVDSNGLETYCSYTVTVNDTQAPEIICVADTSFCDTFLNYTLPTTSDNCGIDTLILFAGLPPGSAFPIGLTTITYVALDTSGNSDTCSFDAIRDEEITELIEAGPNQRICDVTTASLDGTSPSLGIGAWTSLGTATVDDSTLSNSGVSSLEYDVNEFVWTVTNGTCPAVSDTVSIQIDPTPSVANAGEDEDLCEEFETSLTAETAVVGTGAWTQGGNASIADTLDPSSDISQLVMGSNTFTWTISSGVCPPSSDEIEVRVLEHPKLEAVDDQTSFGGVNVQLGVTADIEVSYFWTPTFGLDDPTSASPKANVDESTTYVVEGVTSEGCVDVDTVEVNVVSIDDIYNGITPNGDNINDTWIVFGIENYPDSRITLYNRQGSLVFEAVGYQNDFDGTFKGKKLPAATYYFVIELNDGFTKPFDGNLTIIY